MYKKYHIPWREAPSRFEPIGEFRIERADTCINCGRCIETCIYEVHGRREDDPRRMAEPRSHLCKACYNCIEECPQGALTITINPEYSSLGDDYWTPKRVTTIWFEAETGRIPVHGAGYGGPFKGPGFDELWTDMSEIVRPTRDGIHGREYISTSVDLGRKLQRLSFDGDGRLVSPPPSLLEIPFPIIFDTLNLPVKGIGVKRAIAKAASQLGTFAIYRLEDLEGLEPYLDNLVPYLQDPSKGGLGGCRMVEFEYREGVMDRVKALKDRWPQTLASVRIPIHKGVEEETLELVEEGLEILHLAGEPKGIGTGEEPSRHIKDWIRSVHLRLVEEAIRDEVTLLVSGGIDCAEHVPKAIICGADAVVIDTPLLIALECRICKECDPLRCPVDIEAIPVDWGVQRLMNLMWSWRDQLLEILGAMGLREVRRLRGEVGRAIFSQRVEEEVFTSNQGKEG